MRKKQKIIPKENRQEAITELLATAVIRRCERLNREKKEKKSHVRRNGLDSSFHTKRPWDNPGHEGEKTKEENQL